MDALEYQLKHRIMELEMEAERLHKALATFIAWTVQSSVSPINVKEAELLLDMLIKDEDK